MRKINRSNHKKVQKYYLLGIVSIIAIMVVGIGYAILTQNLNISGTANISSSWDILFTNVTEETLTDSKTISKSITDGTSLTLNVELNQPGAIATYNVTVANRGSLDARLASITDVEEGNQKNPTAIKYRVESISVGDSLLANTEQTFQVIVTWDKSVDITSDKASKEMKVTLNYEQATTVPPKISQIIYYDNANYTLPTGHPTNYIEGKVTALPTPSKDGYLFEGWYETPDFSTSAITAISIDKTGDITVYPKWTVSLIQFEIGSTKYQAESGMTWYQWVNSKYNTDGYSSDDENCASALVYNSSSYAVMNGEYVKPKDKIIANESYYLGGREISAC